MIDFSLPPGVTNGLVTDCSFTDMFYFGLRPGVSDSAVRGLAPMLATMEVRRACHQTLTVSKSSVARRVVSHVAFLCTRSCTRLCTLSIILVHTIPLAQHDTTSYVMSELAARPANEKGTGLIPRRFTLQSLLPLVYQMPGGPLPDDAFFLQAAAKDPLFNTIQMLSWTQDSTYQIGSAWCTYWCCRCT